ncbi:MAG: hypothetical protein QM627_10160, partial [Luteolibacter sp.]
MKTPNQQRASTASATMPGSLLWNLDGKIDAEMERAKAEYVPPTGTKIEQAREIIRRCEELDIKLRDQAIEAENAGDHEACWMNMALRAHNTRFLERVRADL